MHVLQLLDGDYPAWTAAAPALLVLLGLLCVILGRDRARDIAAQSWMGLGLAIGILFVALEVLALFAGGALGPLGLSGFGPSALTSALAITGWIARRRHRRRRRTALDEGAASVTDWAASVRQRTHRGCGVNRSPPR